MYRIKTRWAWRQVSLALALLLGLVWLGSPTVLAQAPNRAGLIVVHGDGAVETRCVGFADESISGYDLLTKAGLDLRTEVTSMGPTICALDNEGCDESSTCFCQCQSSPCVYWSYWQLEGTTWRYATLGAGNSTLGDGAVEGWVWTEGRIGQDAEVMPPSIGFTDICHADATIYGIASQPAIGLAGISPGSLAAGVVVVALPLIGIALLWARRRQA